jgi:hypothetical protein
MRRTTLTSVVRPSGAWLGSRINSQFGHKKSVGVMG